MSESLASNQYRILVEYCQMKLEQGDWHAVSDAANDIRELLAKHPEASFEDDDFELEFTPLYDIDDLDG